MQKANVAIERERHLIPKLEEILPELHNAKIFSKLDLRGYHWILLDEQSQPIMAFPTYDSVYQNKRLIYDINSAFESFQKQIELVIIKIKNAKNISDNIIIWGTSQEQHNKTLEKVFFQIKANGLKINKKKCTFSADQITFSDHTLTSHGIASYQRKIEAINNTQTPTKTSQVKSFLSIVNYYHHFIANFNHHRTFEKTHKKESEIHMGKITGGSFSDTKTKIT